MPDLAGWRRERMPSIPQGHRFTVVPDWVGEILPPGSDNVAIYNASINGLTTSVKLPKSGEYRIRVYLMGNDSDAGKTVAYNVDVSIQ